MEPVRLQFLQSINYFYLWIQFLCHFLSPVCAPSAVPRHLHKRTWSNKTQQVEASGRLITARCASDSSLSVRWKSGASLVSDSACTPPKQQRRRQQSRAWEIGGAGRVCQIRVHCMSLTLTAGDLASGHVPDLGEFQVLLSTVIQLINPGSWVRPLLLLP